MAAPFPSPTPTWHDNTYPALSPSRPELSTKGKTVLITGGGTGIGARTALSFAEAGASRIALLGRRSQPLLETKTSIQQQYPQVEISTFPTDITNKSQVNAAFETFIGKGKLDILISNAGMIGVQDPIKDVDVDKFVEAVDLNLKGALNVAQAFLSYAAQDAVAVEINSSAAHVNFTTKFGAYSVAKLAVFRLWDFLASSHPNLSIFHTQPGVVDTDMNKESGGVDAVGFQDDVSLPGTFNVWLASPEARFLKGKFLWSNWDVDELKAQAKEIEAGKLTMGLVGWPFAAENASWKMTWNSKDA
ncbi:oxidoreductase [Cadophora sp. DSE1049]|nr:oxidoreductase [Cadophora sp. DSE1049]